ncbi:MAG: hypothetical protein J6U66_00950 [Lachnospiraceae bacterium]|nr:hypothetical protein [Lachnospiraceae bacterium]
MRALLSFLSYRQANSCNFLLYASPLLAYHSIFPLGQAFFMLPACLHSLLASQASVFRASRLPALAFCLSSKRFSRFSLAYIRFLPLKQAFPLAWNPVSLLKQAILFLPACLHSLLASPASVFHTSCLPALAFGFSSSHL